MQTSVERILDYFESSPMQACKAMHELLETDRFQFCRDSLAVWSGDRGERVRKLITSLLLSSGLCEEAICDTSLLDLDGAIKLFRCAAELDPLIEVRLGNRLLKQTDARVTSASECLRILEVLGSTSHATRLLPLLIQLVRHPHAHVRSKAVLLLGRGNANVKWAKERLKDANARIRANAIEALWGVPHPEARQLFLEAAGDPNNRVAGNAILGLYYLGDTLALPLLLRMASEGTVEDQATAAWAMGETADPRYAPVLRVMSNAPDLCLAQNALRSLENIKVREAAVQAAAFHVETFEAGRLRDGSRRLRISAAWPDGTWLSGVAAAQVMLWQGASPVFDYSLAEIGAEAGGTAILFPRSFEAPSAETALFLNSLVDSLKYKRREGSWAIVRYGGRQQTADEEPAVFSANRMSLEPEIRSGKSHTPGGVAPALHRVLTNARPMQRRPVLLLVAMSGQDNNIQADQALTAKAAEARVHTILITNGVSGDASGLRALATGTGGTFQTIANVKELAAALPRVILRIHPQWEVRFWSEWQNDAEVTVEIRLPNAQGSATLPGVGP